MRANISSTPFIYQAIPRVTSNCKRLSANCRELLQAQRLQRPRYSLDLPAYPVLPSKHPHPRPPAGSMRRPVHSPSTDARRLGVAYLR